jgi:hypothetical protein
VRDDGSQAGVKKEVLSGISGIGVAPPDVDTLGRSGGLKGHRADFFI